MNSPPRVSVPSRTRPLGPGRILIVDDDPAIRLLIRRALTLAGYDVEEAGDGEQALHAFARRAYDVVISDIIMPYADGLTTILELRRRAPAVRIIAMTGGGIALADDYLETAESFGANRTLAKPFLPVDLLRTVVSLLNEG